MNKVILMGRLTKDPEVKYTQSGMAICRYSLAVNRSYKKEGEPDADFINILTFDKRAEFAGKYFRKGMQVAVCGEMRTGSYEKDGVKRYTTDVVANEQYFAEAKQQGQQQAPQQMTPQQNTYAPQPMPQQSYGGYQQQPSYAPNPYGQPQQQYYQQPLSAQAFVPVAVDDAAGQDLPF